MLFYNAFSNPKFKDIIEKYALLQNLRVELLASQADIHLIKLTLNNYPFIAWQKWIRMNLERYVSRSLLR